LQVIRKQSFANQRRDKTTRRGFHVAYPLMRAGPERLRQCFGYQGGLDVGRRDVAVVPADSGIAAVRGGGHSDHAGISGAQMGIRPAHGIYGVVGAFLYVLGCREPLPGLHERYVAARWRQALGSTMHCVAGDGVGILAGAVLSSAFGISRLAEVALEYILGFAFGWTIFQALFMRDMAGGSYRRALTSTFIPELLSMNLLMAGMVPTMMARKARVPAGADPATPSFWFVMSMGLLVGFIMAYPMNWWLVAYHLKHGMMTVRPMTAAATAGHAHAGMDMAPQAAPVMRMNGGEKPWPPVPVMALLSFLALATGIAIALLLQPM
jgi:hypothetical protein